VQSVRLSAVPGVGAAGVIQALRFSGPGAKQGHYMATSKNSGGSAKKPASKAAAKTPAVKKAAVKKKVDVEAAMPAEAAPVAAEHGTDGVRRRDFINIAAVSFAGVGAAAVVLPLVSQMSASADVMALASIEVDISGIEVGQSIKTVWRKQPVFIRNLTAKEMEEANKVDVSTLRDPQTLAERTQPGKENWLITLGVCSHLGCVPLGAADGEVKGEYGGYFCPCHGSQFDTAARIRKGPAPTNLAVPENITFKSDTIVQIG
jgi:ubiquinol-cytochrome c reductase iron-sulfur subunit